MIRIWRGDAKADDLRAGNILDRVSLMKIRVTTVPPIEEKHGVSLGNEYEVLSETKRHTYPDGSPKRHHFNGSVWVMGEVGERVRLLAHEWEPVGSDEEE